MQDKASPSTDGVATWISHVRAVLGRADLDVKDAQQELRAALSHVPEACLRIPSVVWVGRIDRETLAPLLRRPLAAAEDFFRVRLPAEGADAALLPSDHGARCWTLFLRDGLSSRDELALFVHATVHRLLGHLRDGDPFGHWDRVSDVVEPSRRWDREVKEVLGSSSGGVSSTRAARLAQFVKDLPSFTPDIPFAPHLLPIHPWPHQIRVAREIVESFPRRFLLCDEVGLGKTIETGLAIRELLHRGLMRRCLLLVPRGVHGQWREEMREKLNLHFVDPTETPEVAARAANPWDSPAPLLLASSHLVRRRRRQEQILAAKAWDLVVVDEAHHARAGGDRDPNLLLRLLRRLAWRTRGLLLLTATPLQVRIEEIFDLLALTGLPGRFARESDFTRYFGALASTLTAEKTSVAAAIARSQWRSTSDREEAKRWLEDFWRKRHRSASPPMAARDVLVGRPHDPVVDPDRLNEAERATLREALLRATPLRRGMFRHTRSLIRRYQAAGLLPAGTNVPRRRVIDPDPPIMLEAAADALYRRIEQHLVKIHEAAEQQTRGDLRARYHFLMGVYRQRLTSSFAAVRASLVRRAERLRGALGLTPLGVSRAVSGAEDVEEADVTEGERDPGDLRDEEEAELLTLGERSLARTELDSLEVFLDELGQAPLDAKLKRLRVDLQTHLSGPHAKAIVFTQFTDTLDDLREHLLRWFPNPQEIACYSGRGGEVPVGRHAWKKTTKEEIKRRFGAGGDLRFLLCTDAASEGLNFQHCALLINYDMPWNPMRVEQRIGRIDRIGQLLAEVTILNYFHEGTVEAEVYRRLRQRIQLFHDVIGRPQPILATLERRLHGAAFSQGAAREHALAEIESEIDRRTSADHVPFEPGEDLERPPEPRAVVRPEELESLFTQAPETRDRFRASAAIPGAFAVVWRGREVLATFRPEVADAHPGRSEADEVGVALLSYGHPLFDELLAALLSARASPDRGSIVRLGARMGTLQRVSYLRACERGAEKILSYAQLAAHLETPGQAVLDANVHREAFATEVRAEAGRRRERVRETTGLLIEARAARAVDLLAPLVLIDSIVMSMDEGREDEALPGPFPTSLERLLVARPGLGDRRPIPELLSHIPQNVPAWREPWIDEAFVHEAVGRRRSVKELTERRTARARAAQAWLDTREAPAFADNLPTTDDIQIDVTPLE